MSTPRLRGNPTITSAPWAIGQIPDSVIYAIGRQLIHRIATGSGMNGQGFGDDFGEIFADSADGRHLDSPQGIADVIIGKIAWSVKTVQGNSTQTKVRLISGRNSPDYSYGISNPRQDAAQTGKAVLGIWNARVSEVLNRHSEARILVMIRDITRQEFCLFEHPITQYPADDYQWAFNNNKQSNLEGHDKASGEHCFTWQPHGGQFTIIRPVPGSARRFRIDMDIPSVPVESILDMIEYHESWITIDS